MTPGSPRFVTTRWSQVLAAQGPQGSPAAQAALEELCRSYWYPLYAYGRRRGLGAREAEDAVQGFFAELLEKERLALVDRARGRFRGFLVTAFQRHVGHEREKASAIKRGGGARVLSLDDGDPESRYAREPAHEATPEKLLERDWAVAVLERALRGLRAGYAARGQEALFEAAKAFLVGEAEGGMAEAAARLGMRDGAFRVAVHRLRRRYRAAVREEVAQTLPAGALEAGDCEVELRELATALGG